MKLTVETKALAAALRQASVCAKKVDGILGHALLEAADDGLTISAFDMVREVKTRIPAQIEAEGSRSARASLLTSLANSASHDEVRIEFDGAKLRARSGRSGFDIPNCDPDAYRGLPPQTEGAGFRFKGNIFQKTLAEVCFCADESVSVPSGRGANVYSAAGDDWIIWAMDGKKLIEVRINAPDSTGGGALRPFIYPIQSATIASRLFPEEAGEVEVFVSRAMVSLSNEHMSFTTTLNEGEQSKSYVNWLTPGPHVVKANREALLSAVDLVSAVFDNVGLSSSDGVLRLHTMSTDTAHGESEVEIEGNLPFEVTVQAQYLSPVLRALKGANVELRFGEDPNRPFLVQDGREGVTCVVAALYQQPHRHDHAA